MPLGPAIRTGEGLKASADLLLSKRSSTLHWLLVMPGGIRSLGLFCCLAEFTCGGVDFVGEPKANGFFVLPGHTLGPRRDLR